MALLSLSIKRPSGFLEVPPSPPQSPPVVDAAYSPPSPGAGCSDSPIDGFLRLPLPASGSFERAKKRRKQERPSPFVVDRSCAADEEEDVDQDLAAPVRAGQVEPPAGCVPPGWNETENQVVTASGPEQSASDGFRESAVDHHDADLPPAARPEGGLSTSELQPSTAVVKPVQAEQLIASSPGPVQSSVSAVSFQQALGHPTPVVPPTGYPSSPALARIAGSCGAGSDGEGEGSDGGVGAGVPETCPECRKTFKRRVYLQRHMAREHWSTAKVFKCDKCAYETKHQSNLLVHRRTHTG